MRDSEKFVIRINIEVDKNSSGYPSYKTKIERAVGVAATSPAKIDEAVAAMYYREPISSFVAALVMGVNLDK